MKLKDVQHIIDEYFENVSPEEVIKNFEELGYKFEDINEDVKKEKTEENIIKSNLKIENYMKSIRKGVVF